MAEAQVLDDPYAVDESKPITIAPREWYFFKEEVKAQIAEGNGVDLVKALHAARFYAEIERRTEDIKARRNVVEFTAEEWEIFQNQLAQGSDVDCLKALHAARYWAEIDRRFDRVKAGHWVEHDIIEPTDKNVSANN